MTWRRKCPRWINLFLIYILLTTPLRSAETIDSLFNQANAHFQEKQYDQSIQLYQRLVQEYQIKSPQLYYNLGCAFIKQNEIAQAILYLERANKLRPYKEDYQANLALAREMQQDDIGVIPDFFIKRWAQGAARVFSSTGWAILSIFLLMCTVALFMIWLFHSAYDVKRIVFWSGVVLLVLTLFSGILGGIRQKMELKYPYAIVMVAKESLKMAPDESSKEVLTIHAGLKVKVVDHLGTWSKVELSNKEVGWILTEHVEPI